MPVSMKDFINAATAAEQPSRILLNTDTQEAPVAKAFATGCFACLRNKLSNKHSLNRMTIDAFSESIRTHYNDDFISRYVNESLSTHHLKGRALTAERVLEMTATAEEIFRQMPSLNAATLEAQTSFQCAQNLVTLGTPDNDELLNSIQCDSISSLRKEATDSYWPRTRTQIIKELKTFIQKHDNTPSPKELHDIAHAAFARSLPRSLSFEHVYFAAIETANTVLGTNVYSEDYVHSQEPCVEELNKIIMDAHYKKWDVYRLESEFQNAVAEMVRTKSKDKTPLEYHAEKLVYAIPTSLWESPVSSFMRMTEDQKNSLEVPLQNCQKMLRAAGEYEKMQALTLRCDAEYMAQAYNGGPFPDDSLGWELVTHADLTDAHNAALDMPPDSGAGSWEEMHSPAAIRTRRLFLNQLFGKTPEEARTNALTQFPALTALCSEFTTRSIRETTNPDMTIQGVYMLASFWGPLGNSEDPALMRLPWFVSLCNHFLPDMLHRHAGFPLGGNDRFGLSGRGEPYYIEYERMAQEVAPQAEAFFAALMGKTA